LTRVTSWIARVSLGVCIGVGGVAVSASAQITPAAGYTPPDDTPVIRVGATLFADYSYTSEPEATDADGNTIHNSAYNVSRAYINVTGNISHIVAFRFTPDVARETGTGSSLTGSLDYRVKYAYAQFNLDDWMTRGSYARFGIQQTPYLDFAEGIYRYRFQGTMFVEREGYFASADGGASFHYQLPHNFGDIHVGHYNGENYNRAEVNDQKALMIRGTVRPFAAAPSLLLRGLRVTGFYDSDHYVDDAPRTRAIAMVSFEHQYVNAAFEYLSASDQTLTTAPKVDGQGYSIWATPKSTKGWEGLLRYDHRTPNDSDTSQTRDRTILGIAYWFPHQGNVSAALLLDYDGQTFDTTPALPSQKRVAVHCLINF
jgi:hypothetical protein